MSEGQVKIVPPEASLCTRCQHSNAIRVQQLAPAPHTSGLALPQAQGGMQLVAVTHKLIHACSRFSFVTGDTVVQCDGFCAVPGPEPSAEPKQE